MSKPAHQKMTSKSPMYIYATEMVFDYYNKLDIKNKRVLSIIGSGDQIINAYFLGAKKVVGFDINKYASFMLNLKISAILNLSYLEFIKFFGKGMKDGTLDFNLYNKFKKSLPANIRKFFNGIYSEFNYNGRKLIKSNYFRQRDMIKYSAARINIYLKNEENYLKCRNLIKNKNWRSLELDINNILTSKKLEGKFDIINLSNVLNYITGNTESSNLLKVLTEVTNKVSKKIKKRGIFFGYSYSPGWYSSVGKEIPPASRLQMIHKIAEINNFKVTFKRFKGVNRNTLNRINIFTV